MTTWDESPGLITDITAVKEILLVHSMSSKYQHWGLYDANKNVSNDAFSESFVSPELLVAWRMTSTAYIQKIFKIRYKT